MWSSQLPSGFVLRNALRIPADTFHRQKQDTEVKFTEKSPEAEANIGQALSVHSGLLPGADSPNKGELTDTPAYPWPSILKPRSLQFLT